jgi:hypothetical protein
MTGQGDRNMDQIKASRAKNTVTLDVSKNYRTANGLQVRGLRVEKTNKVVINGRTVSTANYHFIILGFVNFDNSWLPYKWDANGNCKQEGYQLVEQKAEASTQSSLF